MVSKIGSLLPVRWRIQVEENKDRKGLFDSPWSLSRWITVKRSDVLDPRRLSRWIAASRIRKGILDTQDKEQWSKWLDLSSEIISKNPVLSDVKPTKQQGEYPPLRDVNPLSRIAKTDQAKEKLYNDIACENDPKHRLEFSLALFLRRTDYFHFPMKGDNKNYMQAVRLVDSNHPLETKLIEALRTYMDREHHGTRDAEKKVAGNFASMVRRSLKQLPPLEQQDVIQQVKALHQENRLR